MTTLLLVGATGLVGSFALQQALQDARVSHIVAPTRSPLPAHSKLTNPIVDFEHLPEDADWWRVDAAICTLGSTIRKAGSQAAFRRVDHDYPLAVARLIQARGARAYAVVSAMGADADSRIFYNRTKGELEAALKAMAFASLTLVRPGLIAGERHERRAGESLLGHVLAWLDPILPRRYRVVPAERIAQVLIETALAAQPGMQVIESEKI